MITGGCQCGAVRYEADGKPLAAMLCHCRDCQRASGAGHVPILAMPKAGFRVTGETRAHVSPGSSGHNAVRNRCAACGSLLFGTPEVAPGMVTLYVGSLDDPSLFKPEFAIFTRHRAAWDQPSTDLPGFEGMPS